MSTQTISVKELRQQFPRVTSELKKGTQFILIHRSKPIATLNPITTQDTKKWSIDDFVGGFKLSKKLSKKLTPEYINKLAEQRYG